MQLEQHLAVVMTNDKDPDKEFGIQVQIDSLLPGEIYPEFAKPIFPPNWIKVPEVGQIVKVMLIGNDSGEAQNSEYGGIDYPDFIYYDHRILDLQKGKLPSEIKQNYPKRAGMWFDDGSMLYFDQKNGQKEIMLRLTDAKNFIQITESKITIDQNGTKIELANGTMTTTANTSKFGASSATEAILKGTTVNTDIATYLTTMIATTTLLLAGSLPYLAAPIDPNVAVWLGNFNAAMTTLQTALTGWSSTKHFVDQ